MDVMLKKYFLRSFRIFLPLFLFVFFPLLARAGWIEDKDGKTIIHVKAWSLPDPTDPNTNKRADWAVVKSFLNDFSKIFKKKYQNNQTILIIISKLLPVA